MCRAHGMCMLLSATELTVLDLDAFSVQTKLKLPFIISGRPDFLDHLAKQFI